MNQSIRNGRPGGLDHEVPHLLNGNCLPPQIGALAIVGRHIASITAPMPTPASMPLPTIPPAPALRHTVDDAHQEPLLRIDGIVQFLLVPLHRQQAIFLAQFFQVRNDPEVQIVPGKFPLRDEPLQRRLHLFAKNAEVDAIRAVLRDTTTYPRAKCLNVPYVPEVVPLDLRQGICQLVLVALQIAQCLVKLGGKRLRKCVWRRQRGGEYQRAGMRARTEAVSPRPVVSPRRACKPADRAAIGESSSRGLPNREPIACAPLPPPFALARHYSG